MSLDCQTNERYRKKLEAVCLLQSDDPYSVDDRFRSIIIIIIIDFTTPT